MLNRVPFLVTLMILVCVSCAIALESTDVEKTTEWNPPAPGPLNGWSAPLLSSKEFVLQPIFYYYHTRGVFNEDSAYKSYKDGERSHQYAYDLVLYCGITDKLEIDFEGFYYENYRGLPSDANANAGNFGDSIIYARYCLQEEKDWIPCVTALAQMKFPTGKYQKEDPDKLGTEITGTGSYDQGYGVILTKKIKPLILHADFIYNLPAITRVNSIKTKYGDYVNYDFAVEWILPKGFNLLFETNFYQQGDQRDDGEYMSDTNANFVQLVPGIGWSCEKFKVLFCYQRTIAGKNTNVNDSFACTLIYTF